MKKNMLITTLVLALATNVYSQKIYEINAPKNPLKIIENGIKAGGTSPNGGSISFNSYYMSINGRPSIPVIGEFHFSRYPREQWAEEIAKMKTGGISVVSTYIFWYLHEEKEGEFCWTGDRDLRYFIELCKEQNMSVIVRIGPFCHGEIRNGALPDWLFAKPLEVRSNDANYLKYVDRLYQQIANQLKGFYYKDGGPIIGCQIENEMQHSAAPWGINYPGERADMTVATFNSEYALIGVGIQDKKITTAELGESHMRKLKSIAMEKGIVTPFYTVTGWGNAAVIGNEAIPVTPGYTYPFWEEPSMSSLCMFKDLHKQPDYSPVRYNPETFPSFCAEMGVGIQMIYKRRPVISAQASEALMIRTLGSGSNGIGYYMYHGGSTPKMIGNVTSFNDEPMGMPKISYDFQAPLGEFGLEHQSYRYLRTVHTFISDFGDQLAPMETVLPEDWKSMTPENRNDLRFAARMKDDRGFLFLVNFQDHDTARIDQRGLRIKLNLGKETLMIPSQGTFTLPKDASMILPFNFTMDTIELKYATAQLLTKINDKNRIHYFFFAPDGMETEYIFNSTTVKGKSKYRIKPGLQSTFTVKGINGKSIMVTTLTHKQALNSVKIGGKLVITDATVLDENGSVTLQALGNNHFEYVVYPSEFGFKVQKADVEAVKPEITCTRVGERRVSIHFSKMPYEKQVQEYFLKINYVGDVAMAFLGGELVNDVFYHGKPWTIGLKRYKDRIAKDDFSVYIRPLYSDAPFLKDLPKSAIPDFTEKNKIVNIGKIEVIPEYKVSIRL